MFNPKRLTNEYGFCQPCSILNNFTLIIAIDVIYKTIRHAGKQKVTPYAFHKQRLQFQKTKLDFTCYQTEIELQNQFIPSDYRTKEAKIVATTSLRFQFPLSVRENVIHLPRKVGN